MDALTQEFVTANNRLDQARKVCERHAGQIAAIARGATDWRTFRITDFSAGYPGSAPMSKTTITSSEWPTAKEVYEAHFAYHTALFKVRQAFKKLPEDQQKLMTDPVS